MTIFTKLHSIKTNKLPFLSHKKKPKTTNTTSSTTPTQHNNTNSNSTNQHFSNYKRYSLSVNNVSQTSSPSPSQQQQQYKQSQKKPQRSRTISTPSTSFTETLKEISKRAQQQQFDDVFDSFFFSDKRCQDRAIFMTARLKQNIGNLLFSSSSNQQLQQRYQKNISHTVMDEEEYDFWKLVTDRFYTLNYILFVLPNDATPQHYKNQYLHTLEQHIREQQNDGHLILNQRGGMETYFAFYFALQQHQQRSTFYIKEEDTWAIVEKARLIIEHCLDSETKLGPTEKDAMYIFHGMRIGFHNHVEPQIVLDNTMDGGKLYEMVQSTVKENKNLAKQPYENPFEDDACIVHEDDFDSNSNNSNGHHDGEVDFIDYPITSSRSREIDSGFYEGVIKN